MGRVYRSSYLVKGKAANRKRVRSTKWYVSFRDADGILRRRAAFTDKEASRQLLAQLERDAARETVGRRDPFVQHRKRPLSTHLDEWHQGILDKGRTRKHADLVKRRAEAVFTACRFPRWSDISAAKVQRHIAQLRDEGDMGAQTRNFHLAAAKQFCNWMVTEQRAESNPLQHLKGENVKLDRRHERAEFTADQLQRLVTAAHNGPTIRGVPGPERALIYRLAAETGLRAAEVRALTVECFRLLGDDATVALCAQHTKNHQAAELPIRVTLAVDLRGHFGTKMPSAPAFKMPSEYDVALVLRKDLELARAVWLEAAGIPEERQRRERSSFLRYRDDAGRYRDFHSLRHSFATLLKQAGVHAKDMQLLMRHSTISLTMDRYTHSVVGNLSAAVNTLPDFRTTSPEETQQQATGTLGEASSESGDIAPDSNRAINGDKPRSLHGVLHGVSAGTLGSERMDARTRIMSPIGTAKGPGASAETPKESTANKGATGTRRQSVASVDTEENRQPPIGLEPMTCGLQNRCSTN